MWRRIKKRVNSWVFEEVEEIGENEIEKQPLNEQYRSPEMKVKYQYPNRSPQKMARNTNPIEEIESDKNDTDEHDRLKRTDQQSRFSQSFTKRRIQQKEEMKKIQEVPAFMRRERVEKSVPNYENEKKDAHTSIIHTKREELDAVFNQKMKFHDEKDDIHKLKYEKNKENQIEKQSIDINEDKKVSDDIHIKTETDKSYDLTTDSLMKK